MPSKLLSLTLTLCVLLIPYAAWSTELTIQASVDAPPSSQLGATSVPLTIVLDLDTTVMPARRTLIGWEFPELVKAVRVVMSTSGLHIAGDVPSLEWFASDLATVGYPGRRSLFPGYLGAGSDAWPYNVYFDVQVSHAGFHGNAVEFPAFPGAEYYLEAASLGIVTDTPIDGVGDPPNAGEFLSALPALDIDGPDVTMNDIVISWRRSYLSANTDAPVSIVMLGNLTAMSSAAEVAPTFTVPTQPPLALGLLAAALVCSGLRLTSRHDRRRAHA